jgi:hypothetical protein
MCGDSFSHRMISSIPVSKIEAIEGAQSFWRLFLALLIGPRYYAAPLAVTNGGFMRAHIGFLEAQ